MEFKNEIIRLIKKETNLKRKEIEENLKRPKENLLADWSFPCFFLVKKDKKNPEEIARDLAERLSRVCPSSIEKIESSKGYLNFFIDKKKLWQKTLREILELKENYGQTNRGRKRKIIIEFASLNPNKPAHIGNARNACLGDSVARILEKNNYRVIKMDYINDLGIPVIAVFWAINNLKDLPKKRGLFKKEDHWQGAVYQKINQLIEKDQQIKKKINRLSQILESGKDKRLNKKQKEVVERCVQAQSETWRKINVFHHFKIYESDLIFSGLLEKGIKKLIKSGHLFKETKGENKNCFLIKLKRYKPFRNLLKPDKILIKEDGTATYTGKDVILQMWKFGLLNGLRSDQKNVFSAIHVVGNEQEYVIKVLYYTLKVLGYQREFKNSYHLANGLVGFKEEGKISSRQGAKETNLDEILDKAVKKAYKIVKKKSPQTKEEFKRKVAEKIGRGAVRYFLLKENPLQPLQFSWQEALNLEGNSAPYLQYTYARANSILRKANWILPDKIERYFQLAIESEKEINLIKAIAQFPEKIEQAAKRLDPSQIANYLFKLCQEFNSFYNSLPVLKAEKKIRQTRLFLVLSLKYVLKSGLDLLGIEALERI